MNSYGQSILNPSKNSSDWTWLDSRPTYLDKGTMRKSRHDIFSLLSEEFTDYYVDKYLATGPSKNMTCKHPSLKIMIGNNNLKLIFLKFVIDISIVVIRELVLGLFSSFIARWSWRGLKISKEVVSEIVCFSAELKF